MKMGKIYVYVSISKRLTIEFLEEECEYCGGNDLYHTVFFDEENTRKFLEAVSLTLDTDKETAEKVIKERLGAEPEPGLAIICREHDIHARSRLKEDYPGGMWYESEF